jgi:hypothetical protein
MASHHAGDNEGTWKNLEANKKDMNYGGEIRVRKKSGSNKKRPIGL